MPSNFPPNSSFPTSRNSTSPLLPPVLSNILLWLLQLVLHSYQTIFQSFNIPIFQSLNLSTFYLTTRPTKMISNISHPLLAYLRELTEPSASIRMSVHDKDPLARRSGDFEGSPDELMEPQYGRYGSLRLRRSPRTPVHPRPLGGCRLHHYPTRTSQELYIPVSEDVFDEIPLKVVISGNRER
ncbi:hypothetical protein BDD12DRAFT_174458 [Trichophaea hybrida]|nr:hypothetical protein BDD12DRAFT_174458 [Trichophaea hybrida]